MVPRGAAGGDDALREQLSALRGLLVLSMLLTRQEHEAGILHLVASAVESLGHCRTERIRLDGRWTEVRVPQHEPSGGDLDDNMPPDGVRFDLAGVPWSWAYSMWSARGASGCLVVGAEQEPAEGERFLLEVLAQQAGVALANARLHAREREQAEQLRVTNLALQRTMEIHDRLTRVALEGQGQEGIAQAVYELTGYPAAIEDRFGNLLAWAGPGAPTATPRTPRATGTACCGAPWPRPAQSETGSAFSRWPRSARPPSACSFCTIQTGRRRRPSGWQSSTPPRCWPWSSPGCKP